MYNIIKNHRRWKLITAILSLSLLTVMAGAAVAPALNLIQEHFKDADESLIQMIVSMPSIFIALTNLIFRPLCKRFRAKTLILMGLNLYIIGGISAFAFDNIYVILFCRAVLGVGVGIIMPLSTGLISFYFTKDKQAPLMGYSSALNMMGGVIATLISGWLALISWRFSFFVYLLGLISVVLCIKWMPNEKIYDPKEAPKEKGVFTHYAIFIVCMFLLMFTFFIYPTVFALETAREGIIPQGLIAPIMAMMDLTGFAGGLAFAKLTKNLKDKMRFFAPTAFLIAYILLGLVGGWVGVLAGSIVLGVANGTAVPYIISTASMKAGKNAATTVMPWLSAALYLAQFTTPLILSFINSVFSLHSSYIIAIVSSMILFVASNWAVNKR